MHEELRNLQAAHQAEIGALRELLASHGPTGHDHPDAASADRMRDAVKEILRLQKIMSHLDE